MLEPAVVRRGRAGPPGASVETAFERGSILRGGERERRRLPADRDRRDRRVRRDGVYLPCPLGRRWVVRPGGVLRPNPERVRALWQAAVGLPGGARQPAAVVELAHWKVVAVSVEEKRKVAEVDEVAPLGPPVILVSGGRSMRHDQLAGVGSTFPPGLWLAPASQLAIGEPDAWPHSPQPWSSRRHSEKVAPPSLETMNMAVSLCETCGGPFSMAVSGGFVSTVHLRVAGDASGFPARSTARTRKRSRAVVQPRIGLGRRAAAVVAAVELALEGRVLLARGELEAVAAVGEVIRRLGELRRRSLDVDIPLAGCGRRIRVSRPIDRAYAKGVFAPREPLVGLRRGAGLELRAVRDCTRAWRSARSTRTRRSR